MTSNEKIDRKVKRMRNLPAMVGKTDEEIKSLLVDKEKENELDVDALFSTVEEKKKSKELLGKYLSLYNFESVSDLELLKQLVYLEIFHSEHLQKYAQEFNKTNGGVPLNILDSIHKNLNQIMLLKKQLGLTREEKKEEENDGYKALQMLMKKAKVWREQNQASRQMSCPHCGKMVLLTIRTEEWEARKHPFFVDRILNNEYVMKMFKEGRITKEDVAGILGVSADYVDWLLTKLNTNVEAQIS